MRSAMAAAALVALAGCVAPRSGPPLATGTPAAAPPVIAPSAALQPSLAGPLEQGALVRGQAGPGIVSISLDGAAVPVAPDGRFLIGFARDSAATALLVARYPSGRVSRTLPIARRAWDIQSLPTLSKGTPRTPAEIARRQGEIAAIVAARLRGSDSAGWREPMAWPATGRISTHFGSQRIYAGEPGDPHSGTDIARPQGTPVAAPADGVVILAADHPFSLEGNLLMIDHGMGLSSAFLHLSRIDVKVGDHVRKGEVVGAVGMTGRATGPHLHWGLTLRGVRLDPELVAGPMPG